MVRSCALADEIKSVVAMRAEQTAACEVKSDDRRMLIIFVDWNGKRLRNVDSRNRKGFKIGEKA